MSPNVSSLPETASLLLTNLVENADDAIISKDLKGIITSWNPAAERIFGYSAAEVVGGSILVIIPPERSQEETEILRRLGRGERIEHFETVRLHKDGRRIEVSVTISPLIYNGQVIGASKIARDITERKRMEQDLAEARTRLEKYSQNLEHTVQQRTAELHALNQELEAFSYTVAHDLRAPLRAMRGLLGVLEEDVTPGLPADKQELVRRLAQSAERMGQLLEALLRLARLGKQELQLTPTALDELLARAVAELRPETANRQVEWRLDPLPTVECDPRLMQQAFLNLLGNALKYTRPRPVARIEVGQMRLGPETVIYVRDNGIGFNSEQAQQVFTPFHRLHPERQFEGHGIGLATVQRILYRHGGRIWAESRPGEGATFYFTLGSGRH